MKTAFLSASMLSRVKILNALERLLQEEELDSITVRQICEESGIGRTNFYTYFKDKYDVVLWYEVLTHEIGVGRIGRTLTWEEGSLKTFKSTLAKVDMLNKAARSNDRNSINPYFQRWRIENMEETLAEYKGIEIDTKLHYQVVALAAAQTELACRYFNDPGRCPVEEFVDIVTSIAPKELYALIAKPENPGAEDEELKEMELALMIIQQMDA